MPILGGSPSWSAFDVRCQFIAFCLFAVSLQFLQRVPILRGLTQEERGKIADVMVQKSYKDGEHVITQVRCLAHVFERNLLVSRS